MTSKTSFPSNVGEHIKNWRLRYFILMDDGSLRGYKRKPENGNYADPMNDFTVRGCQIMKTDRPKPFMFIMRGLQWTSVIERTFQANDDAERTEWMQAIAMVSQSLPPLDMNGDVEMADEAKQDSMGGAAGSSASASTSSSVLDFFGSKSNRSNLHITSQQSNKGRKIQLDNFEYLKVLGKGTFGKVILCREKKTTRLYAIKVLKKETIIEKDEVAHTLTENRVLQHTKHPFLIVSGFFGVHFGLMSPLIKTTFSLPFSRSNTLFKRRTCCVL